MNPACDTFIPLLSAYVDGESSAADRTAVEVHLSACPACTARVADAKATREVLHASLSAAADEVDFSDFAQRVMARITPAREPLGTRLAIWWREIWTYQRAVIITSLATAAVALGVGGPLIWKAATLSAKGQVVIHSLQADNPNFTPVVMETDDGATMVMFVDHPEDGTPEGTEPRVQPLVKPDEPKGGEL